jgi:hypothetical protein
MSERTDRVEADLAALAASSRTKVRRAVQHCADTARVAAETTGQLGERWQRRIQFMRQRPGAARADWRNDQMTHDQ